jgi:hypothetical protein
VPIGLTTHAAGVLSEHDHATLDPVGQLQAVCALGTLTYAVIEERCHGKLNVRSRITSGISRPLFTW